MNTIILDKESVINLDIKENSICNVGEYYNINELNINIADGVELVINHYSEVINNELKINIIQNNDSIFNYNHSFICSNLYRLDINVELKGNNSKNNINIHGISDNGKSYIKVDGKVYENTIDNELDEKVRVINMNDGYTYIYPNMFVDTKNVVANHAASITKINKDYLFYLNSKGIKDEDAINMIVDGFLDNKAR